MSDTPIYDDLNNPPRIIDRTPNVVITNPRARKIARVVLDVTGLALGTVMAVDAATEAFNVLAVTIPALVGWTYLRAAFGLSVDNPNTPQAG